MSVAEIKVSLKVNGQPVSALVSSRTLLVDLIRDHLKLTGTHVGCDTSQCGACVVHVDGVSVKSCTLLAVQAQDCSLDTIEARLGPISRGAKGCAGDAPRRSRRHIH